MIDEDDIERDSSDLETENPPFFDGENTAPSDTAVPESGPEEVPEDVQASRNRGNFGKGIGRLGNFGFGNRNMEIQKKIRKGRQEEDKPKQKSKPVTNNDEESNENTEEQPKRSLFNLRKKEKDKKSDAMGTLKNLKHPLTGDNKLLQLLLKPQVLVVLALILILVIGLFVALFGSGEFKKKSAIGRGRLYNAECSSITVVDSSSGNNGTYDLEEYVAGVVNAEIGAWRNPTILQTGAIVARTFVLRNHNNCTIAGNTTRQAFTPTDSELIIQAVADTNGTVLMRDGELISTMYDALAVQQETDTEYIIAQQNQHLPKSWVLSQMSPGAVEYNRNHQHGQGMSQWGAYYLATEKNYTAEQILKYYYGDDIEFASIFGVGASDNYTIATSTGSADQITYSVRSLLESNGTSVEQFNRDMLANVMAAGPGTRYGVVAAVSSVVGRLWEEYHVRLPYTMCGAHYCTISSGGRNVNKTGGAYYGVDPDWGSPIGNYYYGSYGPYHYYGPDCSGFVAWALYNGGFGGVVGGANAQGTWGTNYSFSGSFIAQPGDLVWHPGHIMIIIGVDIENTTYYIAHASSGSNGVKIDKVNYKSPGSYFGSSYIVDMTAYYASHANVSTAEEYQNRFLNGMYT